MRVWNETDAGCALVRNGDTPEAVLLAMVRQTGGSAEPEPERGLAGDWRDVAGLWLKAICVGVCIFVAIAGCFAAACSILGLTGQFIPTGG
jgi:hypothetical protein